MFLSTIIKYNQFFSYSSSLHRLSIRAFNHTFKILPLYYQLTSLLWEDGLLIDFLQKKILDKWIKQFLINSANIFNERILFKFIIKFYMDFVLLPQNLYSYFEVRDIASLLMIIWLTTSVTILLVNLNWLFFLIYGF